MICLYLLLKHFEARLTVSVGLAVMEHFYYSQVVCVHLLVHLCETLFLCTLVRELQTILCSLYRAQRALHKRQ